MDRETLIDVARTSLRTKVHAELADVLTEVCVEFHVCGTLHVEILE
jgi:T-complex protein 1 subunit zeta